MTWHSINSITLQVPGTAGVVNSTGLLLAAVSSAAQLRGSYDGSGLLYTDGHTYVWGTKLRQDCVMCLF